MNENYQNQAKNRLITTVVTIVVIAGIVLLIEYLQNHRATNASTVAPGGSSALQQSSASSSSNTGTTSNATYKDGTYTADSQYFVPHGYEDIKVTLTVKDNTVTDSQIVNSESDPESARFQEDFAAEYRSDVVGKKVGDINLSFIAGASDTTNAFNDALNQIRNQAQA